MKAKFLMAICAAALFAVSCGGDEPVAPQEPEVPEVQETPEEPEKVDNPVIEGPVRVEFNEVKGILLESYDAIYEAYLPVTKVEAEIIGGSGDYKIIYPEKVFCKYWGDKSDPMVPYSEDMLKVRVEGNIIKVERVLPAYNPNGNGERLWLHVDFILEDGKGQQKPFGVGTLAVLGGL